MRRVHEENNVGEPDGGGVGGGVRGGVRRRSEKEEELREELEESEEEESEAPGHLVTQVMVTCGPHFCPRFGGIYF